MLLLLALAATVGVLLAQDRRPAPSGGVPNGRRLALVIGNDAYQGAPLMNARNDARAMATKLRGLGFAVTAVEDATRSCLNEQWFTSVAHARALIETWRREYNDERPKEALGGLTPTEYAQQLTERGKREKVTAGL